MSIYLCSICDQQKDNDIDPCHQVSNGSPVEVDPPICDQCYTDHLSALIDRHHLLQDTIRLRRELDDCKGIIR
jgi:hypothetical protein